MFCFSFTLITLFLSIEADEVLPTFEPDLDQMQFLLFGNPVDLTINDKTECDEFNNPDLSLYVGTLYELMKTGGIFEKLFNLPISSDEAYNVFYKLSDNWAKAFGVNDPIPQVQENANLAYAAYKMNKTSPFVVFKTYEDTVEEYLTNNGFIMDNNSIKIAYIHYKFYKRAYDNLQDTSDPFTIFLEMQNGCVEFIKSFGEMSQEDALRMVDKFGIELKCAIAA